MHRGSSHFVGQMLFRAIAPIVGQGIHTSWPRALARLGIEDHKRFISDLADFGTDYGLSLLPFINVRGGNTSRR
jgi:hypothetical protein